MVNPCYRKKTVPPTLAPASKRSKLLESCPWVSCLYLRSISIHIIIFSVIRKIIAIIIIIILPLTQMPTIPIIRKNIAIIVAIIILCSGQLLVLEIITIVIVMIIRTMTLNWAIIIIIIIMVVIILGNYQVLGNVG